MTDIGNNEKSLAGEFFTAAEIYYNGLIAAPTLGNTKHMDILVYISETRRISIEVKTTDRKAKKSEIFGENYEWMMNKKNAEIVDDSLFYCFVLLRGADELPRFFIVPSKHVAEYLELEHKKYESAHKDAPDNNIRTFRVSYNPKLQIENEPESVNATYENNWKFDIVPSKQTAT